MDRLRGKVAVVTGGASGIGEATVRRFVAEGARVAFADRDVERGKQVAAEIEANGGQAFFVEAHVEREPEAVAFVGQAADRFGRLDVLVNNAGIRLYHTVVDASAVAGPLGGSTGLLPSWFSVARRGGEVGAPVDPTWQSSGFAGSGGCPPRCPPVAMSIRTGGGGRGGGGGTAT